MVAGDLKQVSVKHPIGNFTFEAKSGEDVTIMKGGFVSADDDGNFTSALNRIDVKNAKPWSASFTIGANAGDIDTLQALSESLDEGTWIFTFMNNESRTGTGTVVDPIEENKQGGTIAVKIQGSGKLETI